MRNILRPKQAAKYISLSLSTLWRLQKDGDFVQKIQLSKNAVGFYEDEINIWLEKRVVAKQLHELNY